MLLQATTSSFTIAATVVSVTERDKSDVVDTILCPLIAASVETLSPWRHVVSGFRSSIVKRDNQSSIFARNSIYAKHTYAIEIPSVCLSITWLDQSKTAKVRIMQKFERVHSERGC